MQPAICVIKVQGFTSPRIIDNMGLSVSVNETDDRIVTTLSGEVVDQAALMGILNYLYEMGFLLLAFEYESTLKETTSLKGA